MKSSTLRVGLSGRLGNNIFQLINSIIYCHIHQIEEIIFCSQGWHDCGDNLASFLVSSLFLPSGIHIRVEQTSCSSSDNHIMLDDQSLEFSISQYLSASSNLSLAKKDVVSFLSRISSIVCTQNSLEASDIPSSNYIVIHLRGDDVFGKGVPNHYRIPSGYAQPPFSFYTKVLNLILRSNSCPQVIILAQDQLNPVLQVLTDHLENIRVPFKIEFASLPRSFVILQQSKYVISSRGTFVPSILFCSNTNPNVYYFRDEECQYLGSLTSCFMQRYIVKDMLARYTCQGDWMCLPHQKKMMLKYPESALDQPQTIH